MAVPMYQGRRAKGVGNWELLSNKEGPVGVLAGAGVASAPVEEDGEVMMSDE